MILREEWQKYLNQELQPQQPQPQQFNCDKINVYNQDNYKDISYADMVKKTPNRMNTWGRDQNCTHQNSKEAKPTPHKWNP